MADHDGSRTGPPLPPNRGGTPVQGSGIEPPPVTSARKKPGANSSPGIVRSASQRDSSRAGHQPTEVAQRAIRNAPPWLASSILHLLVIIGLAVWVFAPRVKEGLSLDAVFAEVQGEQILDEPILLDVVDADAVENVVVESPLPEIVDPFAAPPELEVSLDGMMASSDIQASIPSVSALDGRREGSKEELLAAFGGNAQSEAAVLAGLKWLAGQQLADGTWSLKGPYSSGAGVENYAAATSMALLAFQGAGHTHFRPGQFKRTVAHGIEALLKMQNKKGSFFDEATGRSSHRFYTHAQATIVVCELYGMTGDENLLEPAVAAVQYLVENQDPGRGGWRYNPRQDSDTSVTGWVVMALQSARMAGLSVPERTFERVMDYLDLVADADESQYAYHTGAAADAPMTAEGLLCRQYLGWPQNDERLVRGANYLLQEKNLPAWKEPDRNVYSWYYATQVMHHMEGDFWQVWNGVMRDLIVENQEVNGREKGSWNPTLPVADRWGHHGGRLFVTCLSIYVLEVYYRHLPIYSNHAGRPKPG